jgi:hypothetical protein
MEPAENTVAAPEVKAEVIVKPKRMLTRDQIAKMKAGARRKREEKKLKSKPLPITPEKINNTPKGRAAATWRPARITDIPTEIKDPRFTYRFILDNPNSIRKRLMEQWEIDMELARRMDERFGARNMQTGLTVDGAYRINELILVRMPVEVAESRRKYFKDKSPVQDSQSMKRTMSTQISEEGGDERSGVYTRHPSGVIPDMNKSGKWNGRT